MRRQVSRNVRGVGPSWRAYLAGLIDGEGCIRINKAKQPVGPNHSYEARLQIDMCDKSALEKMRSLFGGAMRQRSLPKNPKHRPAFTYWATGDSLREILNAVEPYLLIKHHLATAALRCLTLTKQNHQGKKLTPPMIAEREALYLFCRKINQRGVKDA